MKVYKKIREKYENFKSNETLTVNASQALLFSYRIKRWLKISRKIILKSFITRSENSRLVRC